MTKFKILLEGTNEVADFLKTKGYNRTKVSVKHSYYGYDDGYKVTVKDVSIPLEKIKELVLKFRSVDYDERSGEILSGGNTYVDVEYDKNVVKDALNKYEKKVNSVLRACLMEIGSEVDIGNGIKICLPYDGELENLNPNDVDYNYVLSSGRRLDQVYMYRYKGKTYDTYQHGYKKLAILLAQLGVKPWNF